MSTCLTVKLGMQEAGWSPYPSFTEMHQLIYRTEPNVYDGFQMPQGVTEGWPDTHMNDDALDLFRSLLGRPAQLMLEVSLASSLHHPWLGWLSLASCAGVHHLEMQCPAVQPQLSAL